MNSIFSAINPLQSFWSSGIPLTNNTPCFEGLLLFYTKGIQKINEFSIVGTHLIYKSKSRQTVKSHNLELTVVQPITETINNTLYHGFNLTRGNFSKTFYALNYDEYEIWYSIFSKIAILKSFNDDFIISKTLSSGEDTTIYLAQSKLNQKYYAVKSIKKSAYLTRHKSLESLVNEISIQRKLDHPRIVKLFHVYETYCYLYLVMEYISGKDLLHALSRKDKFSEKDAKRFTKKMFSVLKYLRGQHVIHRDIKLENILVVSLHPLEFKLCDFGLACYSDDSLSQVCGSPGYMAPEILKKTKYGPKVDIFSTGVVIYTMLTGTSPFAIGNVEERLISNRKCNICFSECIWSCYTNGVFNFVSKLLRKNPNERPSIDEASKDAWIAHHHKGLNHKETISSFGSDVTSSSNSDLTVIESKTLEMSWERELGCLRKLSDHQCTLKKDNSS